MLPMKSKLNIVIIGGGFAGLSAARQLRGSRYSVTLIDPSLHMEWLPNIHEILSGRKQGDELRLTRHSLLRRLGHRFLANRAMELTNTAVLLDNGMRVPFDACIVATGGVHNSFGVPGADRHALPMKSVAQCQAIARRLQRAALSPRDARVTIVGGGIEGVEALGEVLRAYGRRRQFEFSLVEAGTRLLPGKPASLDARIRSLTRSLPVSYHLGQPVAEVARDRIVLASGAVVPSDITIWSAGVAPNGFLLRSQLTSEPGQWAPVSGALQSTVRPNVFIIGDAADLREMGLAKQAYHAMDMGRCAASNVVNWLQHKPLQAYEPAAKPQVVTFGELETFVVFRDFALSSAALGPTKEAIYTLGLLQLSPPASTRELWASLDRLQRSARRVYLPALNPIKLWRKLPATQVLN